MLIESKLVWNTDLDAAATHGIVQIAGVNKDGSVGVGEAYLWNGTWYSSSTNEPMPNATVKAWANLTFPDELKEFMLK